MPRPKKSGAWRVDFQLPRDILQRRKRHEQMHLLVRCLYVNLQFSVARTDLDVLLAVHDFDQVDVGIFFQFLHNRTLDRECSTASLKCFCGTRCIAMGTAAAGTTTCTCEPPARYSSTSTRITPS